MASTTKQMNISAGNAQATVNATVNDSMPAIPCPDPAGYKYVGARYVPLFADPLEWNNQTTYEPLTIVVHEGNSYTSRTHVPTGIDISNTDYWALTGNYNAQIEQYRQEVQESITQVQTLIEQAENTFNTQIKSAATMAGKLGNRALIIGNSYTAGVNVSGGGMGARIGSLYQSYTMKWADGAGFNTYTYNSKPINTTFLDLLNQGYNEMSADERTQVTDIWVVSAMGDTRYIHYNPINIYDISTNKLAQALNTFATTAKSLFGSNVKLHLVLADTRGKIVNIGNTNPKDIIAVHTLYDLYSKSVYNFNYYGWIGYPNLANAGVVQSDGYHPTEYGYNVMFNCLKNKIYTGRGPIKRILSRFAVVSSNGTGYKDYIDHGTSQEIYITGDDYNFSINMTASLDNKLSDIKYVSLLNSYGFTTQFVTLRNFLMSSINQTTLQPYTYFQPVLSTYSEDYVDVYTELTPVLATTDPNYINISTWTCPRITQ